MVGGAPLLRHGQNPRDWLTSPTDHQLSFSGNQLSQSASQPILYRPGMADLFPGNAGYHNDLRLC